MLYIPHGSDESLVEFCLIKSYKIFISHMVQMKEAMGSRVMRM